MTDTVNVLGHALPKKGLIAGGVVAAAATAYVVYRNHQKALAGAAAPATAAGYGYGYAYGYGLGIASYGYGAGVTPIAGGGGSSPIFAYGYGSGIGVGTTTAPPITNAQWAAAAEEYLTQTAGYDATTVAAALGKFLTGGTLTSDQAQIVQAALAFENNPPTAGANGFPPGVHIEAPGGQGGGGTGTTPAAGTVTVPNVVGMSANAAIAKLTAAGLTSHLSSQRNPISTYKINSQTPGAGKKVAKGSNVDLGIVKT